jgi:hypothetical protein
LENAELEKAANEKLRLEDKQREAKRTRKKNKEEWKPRWFYKDREGEWVYKGGYWQAKQYGDFQDSPDIF